MSQIIAKHTIDAGDDSTEVAPTTSDEEVQEAFANGYANTILRTGHQ